MILEIDRRNKNAIVWLHFPAVLSFLQRINCVRFLIYLLL